MHYGCSVVIRAFIFLILMVASGCNPVDQTTHADLVQTIEQSIELPAGSEPLESYARVYKSVGRDRISAVYFIPDRMFIDEICQSAKSSGPTNGQLAMLCPPPDGMRAGESRWVGDDVHLPVQSDGGCSYIEIEYSIARKAITSARCNEFA